MKSLKYRNMLAICFATLLLMSCGKADVKSVKDVPAQQQSRLKEVSQSFWSIKRGCEAIK